MANLESKYAAAVEVTLQWLCTWHKTGAVRHLNTAVTCATIADELFVQVQAERKALKEYRQPFAVIRFPVTERQKPVVPERSLTQPLDPPGPAKGHETVHILEQGRQTEGLAEKRSRGAELFRIS